MSAAAPEQPYEARYFAALSKLEPQSFWFRARNRLILSLLARHAPHARSYFEVGCGTGFVLAAVREAFPALRIGGGELFAEGLEIARSRLPGTDLRQLDVLELPFEAEWDAVGCFDVLEHVEDDAGALARIRRALTPGGIVLLSVPQHPWLWGEADDFAHHRRRYRRRDLVEKLDASGLHVVTTTSFVTAPLPAMALARLLTRVRPRAYDPVREIRPPRAVNRALEFVLDVERALIERGARLPVGGSLFAVARRAETSSR